MWSVGERVLGKWDLYWYPGTVKRKEGQRFYIKFDDDDEDWLGLERILPLDVDVGSEVSVRWKGGRVYYDGKIIKKDGDRIHVLYKDGDREWTEVRMVRVLRALPPSHLPSVIDVDPRG